METDEQTYKIIGAAMTVHRELGRGFLEAVYQAALERELTTAKIPFEREKEIPVFYKGKPLPIGYRADFLCYGEVVVELKALSEPTANHRAQVINYLKATGIRRALLINFGTKSLDYKRLSL